MRLVPFILSGLFLYLWGLCVTYAAADGSIFINGESLLYLSIITFTLMIFWTNAEAASRPLFIVLIFYTFTMYLFGAYKLLLFSFNSDVWTFEIYNWARSSDINHWLRYSLFCTVATGSGLLLGTKLISNKQYKHNREILNQNKITISIEHLLILYVIFLAISIYDLAQFGYGAISGQEGSAISRLYGIIDVDIIVNMALIIGVYQWDRLSKYHRRILLFITLSMVVYRVVAGSRSALYAYVIPLMFYLSLFRGNFVIRKKLFFLIIIASLLIYPIAKGFKDIIKYGARPDLILNLAFFSENFSIGDVLQSVMGRKGEWALEVVDRLSDMNSQLRIINDKQVIPADKHINLIATFKRIINDMVPGDVFEDVLPTQYVYHVVYLDFIPVYGGENYSLYGVYYVLFGYFGAVIGLFISALIIGYLWKALMFYNISWRPIILGYFLVIFHQWLLNELIEGWFVNRVYRPLLTLIFIFLLLKLLALLSQLFRQKPSEMPAIERGDLLALNK